IPDKAGGDPGARAELVQREVPLLVGERGALAAPALLDGGGELLPDDAERQELVALQAQDRLQPVDLVLAEQAVAAGRAPRRQQALVLQVADLRDRDVRELRLEAPAHGADRLQPRRLGAGLGGGCDADLARKTSRYW